MPPILRLIRITALALLVAGSGCAAGGRVMRTGVSCYNAGDYLCASAAFNQIETSRMELTARGKLHYLTYGGLTHFRLGHWEPARRFLTEAFLVYRASDPRWLPTDAVSQMHLALAELTRSSAGPTVPGANPSPSPAEPIDIQ